MTRHVKLLLGVLELVGIGNRCVTNTHSRNHIIPIASLSRLRNDVLCLLHLLHSLSQTLLKRLGIAVGRVRLNDRHAAQEIRVQLTQHLQFALRGGGCPQMVAGTTPRRNSTSVKYLVREGAIEGSGVVVTRGSMYENRENLPDTFLAHIERTYGGTSLARQEVEGELLSDVEGATVTQEMIEAGRVEAAPQLTRIAIGVDPSGGRADQGIVAVGLGIDGKAYVLDDWTCNLPPAGWGRRAVELYGKHSANVIVAERNFGGDMVESTIRSVDPLVPIQMVTASRGKHVRFEPVGSLYEQGRVCHVGVHPELEDEITCFTPDGYEGDDSPNRADAEVWAVHELMLKEHRRPARVRRTVGTF